MLALHLLQPSLVHVNTAAPAAPGRGEVGEEADRRGPAPDDAVDHLAALPGRLAVPAYVRWWASGHWLAIEDKRTEGSVLFGQQCLEIFRSVSADSGLERAVVANTQRLSIFPSTARANIEDAAASLFRKGLLRPAPGLQETSPDHRFLT
ncbi:hypothetical protein [Streptomyces chartreusis]